ncbi:bifunctional diguanylate cyclase/phosphodiesterase [Photobacterium leiognathi]|uniref:bifunctional diguanylate cyclase/phosphodiesterase n=1 Tax=Photobacterium leiognathi TaxID=553611 RepID=UPI002982B888|nr:EAL domain-containing protein [Photobacterium leiognathi]
MTLFKRQIISITTLMCSVLGVSTGVQLYTGYNAVSDQHISRTSEDINRALDTLPSTLSILDNQIITRRQESELIEILNYLFPAQHYNHSALLFADSTPLIRIDNQRSITNVPQWFQSLITIPEHIEKRMVNNNNYDVGIIEVSASPRWAYTKYWQLFSNTLLSHLFLMLAGGCLIYIISKKHFASLQRLTTRAQNIDNLNQAPMPLPEESDIKTIVRAFNKLTYQLDVNFKNQANEAVKLREQAYLDPISGLGNRSFFIHQISSWLDESHKGGLALIQTTLISDYYEHKGYQAGDKLIKQIAARLNEVIIYNDATISRLSRDEFAVLIPNLSSEKLTLLGKMILKIFTDIERNSDIDSAITTDIGLVYNEARLTPSQLLTQLDNALTQAKLTPHESIALIKDPTSHDTLGKQQWKQLLEQAINEDLFQYKFQPATLENRSIYHYEVFTGIQKNKDFYSAGQFLGAIEDLKIGSWFDRHVIVTIINRLNADRTIGPFAINVTNSSIADPSFIRWLDKLLANNTQVASRLFFELQEISCIRNTDATSILCSTIKRHRFGVGIDNYGRHFQSLTYLKEINPDYVKIDYAYTYQLNDQTKSAVLSSICRTAHSLDIKAIATRVETETQLERLSDLFVSGYQGFITEKYTQLEKV